MNNEKNNFIPDKIGDKESNIRISLFLRRSVALDRCSMCSLSANETKRLLRALKQPLWQNSERRVGRRIASSELLWCKNDFLGATRIGGVSANYRQIVGKLKTETRLTFRDVWYPAHRRLLVLIKHLGVNLRGIQKAMP